MATNLGLDDQLIEEALALSGVKSKKDAVDLALKEFIKMMKRRKLLGLAGKIQFESKYNYKKQRSR